MSLSGKVAIVTGTTGIGRAIAASKNRALTRMREPM
jgi:hypothetical protein